MTAGDVYVVEDEEAIRRSLHLMLRVLGCQPRTFESGPSFLAAQPEIRPGCVLLDLRMPEMDGLEVQRQLAKRGANHPVVVMSGHGDLATAVAAMEQGAIAFLEKPFPRTALEQALGTAFLKLRDPDGYREYLCSAQSATSALEPTDRRVLELMADGCDPEGIAAQTSLPLLAIEVSRSRIFAALEADTATEVLRLAYAARRARSL